MVRDKVAIEDVKLKNYSTRESNVDSLFDKFMIIILKNQKSKKINQLLVFWSIFL